MKFFRKETDVELTAQDLRIEPLTPLLGFIDRTKKMIERLDGDSERLREEIDNRMALLADIERIRAAQQLALEHMEN